VWGEFVERYRPALYAAARDVVGSHGDAYSRELADSLCADLHDLEPSGGERRHSLLDDYHGRSRLVTWLRTVLAQRHVDSLTARGISLRPKNESQIGPVAVPPAGARRTAAKTAQVVELNRARLLPLLQRAFDDVVAALDPSDRLLVSLCYVEELSITQIAQLRGVPEITVSRRLAEIRREVHEAVERELAIGRPAGQDDAPIPALSPTEIRQCFDYVAEDLRSDLRRALAESDVRKRRAKA
jgi:RNA polymerase sigma-70 factor (ECF subfamily)